MHFVVRNTICEISGHISYLLTTRTGQGAVVIDPPHESSIAWQTLNADIQQQNLCLSWVLHTCVDPIQLTAAKALKALHLCAQSAIGVSDSHSCCSQFDRIFGPDEVIKVGHVTGRVVNQPADNPSHAQYQFDPYHFLGDSTATQPSNSALDPIYLPRHA